MLRPPIQHFMDSDKNILELVYDKPSRVLARYSLVRQEHGVHYQVGDKILMQERFCLVRNAESPVETYFLISEVRSCVLFVTTDTLGFELGKVYPAREMPDNWIRLVGAVQEVDNKANTLVVYWLQL